MENYFGGIVYVFGVLSYIYQDKREYKKKMEIMRGRKYNLRV